MEEVIDEPVNHTDATSTIKEGFFLSSTGNNSLMIEERIVGEPVNKGATVFYLLFGLFILLSGVLGNGFLLLVLATQRKLWEVHNIFIANLALADLVVVCSGLPFLLLDLLLGYQPVVNEFHCEVNGFVLCLAYSVSILSLVSISFNRYMKVCHYNLFPKLFSVRKNALFCVGLWALGCVLQTPLLAGYPSYGYDAGSHCCQARSVRKEINYGGMAMSVLLAGPVVMIGYFNYSIFHTWNQSRSKFKGKEKRKEDGEVEAKPSLPGKLKSVFYVEISDSDISSDMPRSTNVTGASAETEMADYTVDKPSAIFASGVQERSASNDRSLPAEADADNTLYTRDFTARLQIEPDITPACSVSNLAANTSSDKIIFSPDPAKEKSKVKSPEMESSEKGAKKKKHHTTTRAEVALVRSLLVISICLLVLYTPFAVCLLTDYGTDVSSEVMVFVSLLLFVNCAVNWVIYGAMNTSFRQGYARTLRRLKCRCFRGSQEN